MKAYVGVRLVKGLRILLILFKGGTSYVLGSENFSNLIIITFDNVFNSDIASALTAEWLYLKESPLDPP